MANDNDGGYLTGYKRPPRDKQFRKGQSGNPRGPRPGARSVRTIVRRILDERLLVIENGKRRKLPKVVAIFKQIAKKALTGDLPSARLLLAISGAADERDGLDDGPIPITLVRRILDAAENNDSDDSPIKTR
jgi:Family of unknown function (DUF5681)